MARTRTTIVNVPDRREQLRVASRARQDVIESGIPVWLDPKYPLGGIHRDPQGNPYFEFDTEDLERVKQLLRERRYEDLTNVAASDEPLGEACSNCGNIAGPVLPAVCPNCGFREISACPVCGQNVSRKEYQPVAPPLFLCPNPHPHIHRVRLSFNDPMFDSDGTLRQPLVIVSPAEG